MNFVIHWNETALSLHQQQTNGQGSCGTYTPWNITPVLLPGKSHGQRSLVGCSLWGREESDTTEQLHFHFSLSCIEGNGSPLHSVLAWRIPGTAEPGGLTSMGSHKGGHDWSDLAAAAAAAAISYLKKKNCTLVWDYLWASQMAQW